MRATDAARHDDGEKHTVIELTDGRRPRSDTRARLNACRSSCVNAKMWPRSSKRRSACA